MFGFILKLLLPIMLLSSPFWLTSSSGQVYMQQKDFMSMNGYARSFESILLGKGKAEIYKPSEKPKPSVYFPTFGYGFIMLMMGWLFWGVTSFFRNQQHGTKKKSRTIVDSMAIDGVPIQYTMSTEHDILGVSKDASKDEIEAAYQAKMATFDPERIANMGKSIQQEIEAKKDKITKAYETLMQE